MGEVRMMRSLSRVLAISLLFVACVPEPANRQSHSPDAGATITPAPTPLPTPAGPTPSPSFVRPTPTPEPTFFAYTVVKRDTLTSIAKRFHTSGRSIAYWNRATYPSLDPDSPKYKPDRITIGWVLLLIPGGEVDPENLPTMPLEPPPPTPAPTPLATASPSG